MYLCDKTTYQAMQGAFEAYLREIDKPIKFSVRDRLLAKSLFNQTPDEIHQKLSRNRAVPIDWSIEEGSHCLSLWKRIKRVMEEVELELDDSHLHRLFALTIAEVFHRLERSMTSGVFQTLLAMQIVPLQPDKLCHSAATYEHRLLATNLFFYPRHSYTQSLFNDRYYVPSSSPLKYPHFDDDTYKIVRDAYETAIENAQRYATLLAEEVALLEPELQTLRNNHRLLLVFQTDKQTVQYLVDEIVESAESDVRSYIPREYYDDDSFGTAWWEGIDIKSDYRWHSALKAMNIDVPYILSFEDYMRDLAEPHNLYINSEDALEFASMLSRRLYEIGRYNDLRINEHANAYQTCQFLDGEQLVTLPEAIESAYIKACSDLRKLVTSQVRLLTKKERSHHIYDLIPK